MTCLPEPVGPLPAQVSARWLRALTDCTGSNLPGGDMAELAGRLAEATLTGLDAEVRAEASAAGHRIGAMLAQARLIGPSPISRGIELLAEVWVLLGGRDLPTLSAVQASAARAYAAVQQDQLLDQQEAIHRAAITAHRESERRARAADARFRALFEASGVGMGVGDMSGQILDANPALQRLLGYTLTEFQARRVEDFIHPEDAEAVWQGYSALLRGDLDVFRTEKRYRHKDGHDIWTNLTVSLVRGPNGAPAYQLAMLEDVSERHDLAERLRHAATHDALTGLPNRTLFQQRLTQSLGRPAGQVAITFIDLDDFKMINDTWGHMVGDEVLREVARRLGRAALDAGADVARLSGDEFVVLHPAVPPGRTPAELARHLVDALRAPLAVAGVPEPLQMRASAGVVVHRSGGPVRDLKPVRGVGGTGVRPAVDPTGAGAAAEDLMRAADLALHTAKEEGRARVVVHDPDRTVKQISRFGIAMALPGVVERDELAVAYQPMVRLDTGDVHAMEALVRWRHPQLGELPPAQFVGVAEESSAISTIGIWVLEQACRDLAAQPTWPSVNVNVSVRQLYSPRFVADVRGCLSGAAIDPQRLKLEVTETVLLHSDHPGPPAALSALADLGVQIVIDDFGVGYANWASLRSRRWPLHELKLAGAFVERLRDVPVDPVDVKLLSTLVDLAHSMNLLVTAEGVEDARQDHLVRCVGCDVGQGWFYASPALLATA